MTFPTVKHPQGHKDYMQDLVEDMEKEKKRLQRQKDGLDDEFFENEGDYDDDEDYVDEFYYD